MPQITMNDIAKQAGVSRHTVSKVLNNRECYVGQQTREKVLAVVRQLNYRPNYFARSLKEGKTRIIGVTTFNTNISIFEQQYPANIFSGVLKFFSQHDYKLIFHNFSASGAGFAFHELAESRIVDGLVFLLLARDLKTLKQKQVVQRLNQGGVPFVVVHSLAEDLGCPAVGLDSQRAGYLATGHLAGHGYKTLGMVICDPHDPQVSNMHRGYCQALAEHGLAENPDFVYHAKGIGFEHGYDLAGRLLRKKTRLPRALFVLTDDLALGMVKKFNETGFKVPEELALAGFRNENRTALNLAGLTSVQEPAIEKGFKAGELLWTMLENPGKKVASVIFTPELVIRKSCGCP